MTISVVQATEIFNGFSGNFSSNVAIGNSIVIAFTGRVVGFTVTTSAPTYNGGSVAGATKIIEQQCASLGATYVAIWLLPNVATSGTSISFTTNSGNGSFVGLFCYEVAGLGTSPAADKSASATNSGATDQASGPSGNITAAPEFVVGVVCQDSTIGAGYPPAGWTNATLGTNNSVSGYQIPTSSGSSYNYDIGTGNADWTAAVATIQGTPVPGGAAAAPPAGGGKSMLGRYMRWADL